MHPNMLRLGPLDVLSMGRADAWITVVMFHGYGADAFDLLPLSQELTNGRRVRWLFPQGVLEVPLGFHMMGRAWFPIDIDALNQAMAQGGHRDFARERPPGMNEACMAARAMLDELNIPMGRIVLGGFSQGAMIATESALTGQDAPAGLVAFSGTLMDAPSWRRAAEKRSSVPYVQSHGRMDPILSFTAAESLNQLLRSAGLQGSWIPFDGGHEIPRAALVQVDQLIAKLDCNKKD